MNGKAMIVVISPLISIIKNQLQDKELLGYSAVDCNVLLPAEIHQCNFKIMYATAEKVKEKTFREIVIDLSYSFHQNICAIVVDESHTVETWTGKR